MGLRSTVTLDMGNLGYLYKGGSGGGGIISFKGVQNGGDGMFCGIDKKWGFS